ncbi:hypothetical protein [Nostoc sp. MG11]|uniref:hypothetical protein n=1 Tax=Nostoc sp. MG11 TaxID=2721166 RepID=UPI001867C773|nr:hypothetical protein [Nostoc sp. MG11]
MLKSKIRNFLDSHYGNLHPTVDELSEWLNSSEVKDWVKYKLQNTCPDWEVMFEQLKTEFLQDINYHWCIENRKYSYVCLGINPKKWVLWVALSENKVFHTPDCPITFKAFRENKRQMAGKF